MTTVVSISISGRRPLPTWNPTGFRRWGRSLTSGSASMVRRRRCGKRASRCPMWSWRSRESCAFADDRDKLLRLYLRSNPLSRYDERGRTADPLQPEGFAGEGQGVQLAACPGHPVLWRGAPMLTEGGGADGGMEAAGVKLAQ